MGLSHLEREERRRQILPLQSKIARHLPSLPAADAALLRKAPVSVSPWLSSELRLLTVTLVSSPRARRMQQQIRRQTRMRPSNKSSSQAQKDSSSLLAWAPFHPSRHICVVGFILAQPQHREASFLSGHKQKSPFPKRGVCLLWARPSSHALSTSLSCWVPSRPSNMYFSSLDQ